MLPSDRWGWVACTDLGRSAARSWTRTTTHSETTVTDWPSDKPLPQCFGLTHLFFSPEEDGRDESGRRDRETKCKEVCFRCPYRIRCLRRAVINGERFGVWGGLSEHEMRMFRAHLKREGYIHNEDEEDEIPDGLEFMASLASFYTRQRMLKVFAKEA